MRLGADVLVFSRHFGKEGQSSTQSIGLLSYTFLTNTGKEDIIVPMIDYVKEGEEWARMTRSSPEVWKNNLETILQWSPYYSEADLLQQFNSMVDQGTQIVIYNLWDDDQGELELDFDADQHDIQVRGVNCDEKKIQMAKQYPNLRHFLTYRHSLKSYASILYLKIPVGFKIILRGKEIEHHNIVNDMMVKEEIVYRPQPGPDSVPKNSSMVAAVTIGFVKDAKDHVDVQGFNVYHKNRLIKPFWRIWNAAGSAGRGVIGVLEANFVEPAHDKQGFERTTVLSRLETRLLLMQKSYWTKNCHKIGYASRYKKSVNVSDDKDSSPEPNSQPSYQGPGKGQSRTISSVPSNSVKMSDLSVTQSSSKSSLSYKLAGSDASRSLNGAAKHGIDASFTPSSRLSGRQQDTCDSSGLVTESSTLKASSSRGAEVQRSAANFKQKETDGPSNVKGPVTYKHLQQLTEENETLKKRLNQVEEEKMYERDKNKALTGQVAALEEKMKSLNTEQEAPIDIFQEERSRRETEEENLRQKLKEAAATIKDLAAKKLYAVPNQLKHER